MRHDSFVWSAIESYSESCTEEFWEEAVAIPSRCAHRTECDPEQCEHWNTELAVADG